MNSKKTKKSKYELDFMQERSTMEAIFSLMQLMEEHQVKRKNLQMVLINLEKASDKIPRDLIWWV